MFTPLECIALRCVRLNDSKSLLSVWTRTHGRVTFAIPAGSSRQARRCRAITGPMMIFSGISDIRPGKDIFFIRDIQSHSQSMIQSPEKTMVAIFLSEVLDRLLRRGEPDEALSEYLFSAAETFSDISDKGDIANFHILFLFHLTRFLGIGPRLDTNGDIFDLREASFRHTPPLHPDFIDGRGASFLRVLDRFRLTAGRRLPINSVGRRTALNRILDFYGIHLENLSTLKSLEILRSLIF